jgi:hypothetical protein
MAALRIDSELRLVDRGKGKIAAERALVVAVATRNRHALGGAQEIAGLRRDDAFLAGQQRDLFFALHGDHAVVDLTREQAEREADDARGVAAHPFDRQVRLAGVGRSQDGPDRSVRAARHHR